MKSMWRVLVGICLFLGIGMAVAACRPGFTTSDRVRLTGDAVMVVVHPSSTFDARFSAKRGLDEAIRFAQGRNMPIVLLQDDSPVQYYYIDPCAPDYRILSEGGELSFPVPPKHLYIVGGHLELCLSTALHEILYRWAQSTATSRTVTYFMDAIYSNGKLIDPGDVFYGDFERFMGVVTHGRPGGEHWPKLNLLETLGVIRDEDHQLDYLKQVLPRWDTTFPENWRVELQLNASVVKVLRPAAGWQPPTLRFHFIDSALLLDDLNCRANGMTDCR